MHRGTVKSITTALGLAGMLALTVGCSRPPGRDTTPPTIISTEVTNATDYHGGGVTISVNATDPSGVAWAQATITKPDNTTLPPVSLIGATGTTSTYSVTCSVPGNATLSAETYSVVISVADTPGNISPSQSITFLVPSAAAPPDPANARTRPSP